MNPGVENITCTILYIAVDYEDLQRISTVLNKKIISHFKITVCYGNLTHDQQKLHFQNAVSPTFVG